MNEPVYHIPALLGPTLELMQIKPDGIYVDATYGGGGHSRAIVDRLASGHLYSFDQDADAVARAIKDPRFTMIYSNFRYMRNFLRYYGVMPGQVDAVLADLGVSFHHFDSAERGFSFRFDDAPLDMRMNRASSLTAATMLNEYTEEQIADTLYLYGELKNARKLAAAIIRSRAKSPLATTADLIAAVSPLINPRQEKKELAQIFQAMRIVVNDEMAALRQMLTQAADMLRPGGRLAVITYHSLEDRLVKNFMKAGNFEGKIEKDFYGRALAPLKPISGKPVTPTPEEIDNNPRCRSAKLRVAVKI